MPHRRSGGGIQQIPRFGVACDVRRDEGATRDQFVAAGADEIQRASSQRRANAFAAEDLGHFGMGDGDPARRALIRRKGDVAFVRELETVAFEVVDDDHRRFTITEPSGRS